MSLHNNSLTTLDVCKKHAANNEIVTDRSLFVRNLSDLIVK